ncbi:MAG: bifunctional UDP-N-acetylmuramoyl-tripeptide:D-alanyl-D-alanine ligase/alanine racemase [Hyphomicrobiales bacterium]
MTDQDNLRIEKLSELLNGKLINTNNRNIVIKDILIDSRKLICPDNCVFFALSSTYNDGHKYINELYEKGVKCFVISKFHAQLNELNNASFIIVNDTIKALQTLGKQHRRKFNFPIIGITGSNGKTIVKEWLFQLLHYDYNIVRSPKSYNSQIGVPLSVWQITKKNNLGIFEAGISEPNEMDSLQEIINPDIGIFTNIGEAHGENFINKIQKAKEKLKLFASVKTLIFSSNYPDISQIITESETFKSIDLFSWGKENSDNLIITDIITYNGSSLICASYNDELINLRIPFVDDASIENAIHCWAYLLILNYPQMTIQKRFLNLTSIAMRMELKEGINGCSLINDSYNSDVRSLNIALDFMNQQNHHKEKTLIISDILQSGKDNLELYQEVSRIVNSKGVTKLIGIGNSIGKYAELFSKNKVFYTSTKEFLEHHPINSFHNETILLKGARTFEFEQITKTLQQKSHETVLEINMDSIINNLNIYRNRVKSSTMIMAMVKAFSYGSGSFEIANLLQYHNIDYLAVAYVDEGVELRKAGIRTPIMVMNPEINSFGTMIIHRLEPEIYSFRTLSMLEIAIENSNISENTPVKIHLKIDTGMHRLGFVNNEIQELIARIKYNKSIQIQSIFSHLAASDDPQLDSFSNQQIESFSKLSKEIRDAFPYSISRHILNSAGITRFPKAQFEMVRLGIGLYGIAPEKNMEGILEQVGTLKTSISQIKDISINESVGYGRAHVLNENKKIAIIPIGYADGISRKLGNGKISFLINGKLAKTIGNICMDMLMLDVTGINAKEGDPVIIFGKENPIIKLANAQNTIPYEILTSISRRVKRIYFHE